MSAGIPPPSESPLNPTCEIPVRVGTPNSNHRESRSGPEIPANAEMMVYPQRGAASKQSVFQNNIALQTELQRIQEGRVHGLQLSDFRRSGMEDDFDSKNIDVRGLVVSLRLLRANSQIQYRTLRRRRGEVDSVSPAPTAAESDSLEESRMAIFGSSRVAKAPIRKRTYQEPRRRRGSKYNEDPFSTAGLPRKLEFTPPGRPSTPGT